MSGPVTRTASALVLGGLFALALALGAAASATLVAALALIALAELYALQRRRGLRPVPIVGFAAVIALVIIAYSRGERAPQFFPAAVSASLVFVGAALVVQRRIEGSLAAIASSVLGIVYVGVLGAYVVVLLRMAFGARLLVALIVMTASNDVFSYAIGAWRGRRALAPSVSPTKTWEGVAGGTVATIVAAFVITGTLNPPFDRARALILGAVVALAAPLGDLVESMVVRDAEAAGSGKLVPGHGGVLDRIDSVLFAAPLFFYAYRALVR